MILCQKDPIPKGRAGKSMKEKLKKIHFRTINAGHFSDKDKFSSRYRAVNSTNTK